VEELPTAGSSSASASLADLNDVLCAICLDAVVPEDSAIIKDCQHMYCVNCILKWSLVKEDDVSCPKCKTRFTHVYTYRSLDGTLTDFPQEESVCLLRRATWFEDAIGSFKGKAIAVPEEIDLDDWYDDDYYDEDDDDDIEDYLASSGGGRTRLMTGNRGRVTIGNRRWGTGGYIQSGRMAARPAATSNNPRPSKAEARVARKEQDVAYEPARGRRGGGGKKSSPAMGSSPPSSGKGIPGPSPSGGGRRARRAAKRAEMDAI